MPEQRGTTLALTASFKFCGIGVGSAIAEWLYPVFGYIGLLLASLMFLLPALVSLRFSERCARFKLSAPGLSCSAACQGFLLSGLSQPIQPLVRGLIRPRTREQTEVFQCDRTAVDIGQLNRG